MNNELTLVKSGSSSDKASEAIAYVLASVENDGAFRHIANGYGKAQHLALLVDAVIAFNGKGLSATEIKAQLAQPQFQVGNTSQWSKWLNTNIAFEDEDGKQHSLASVFGSGEASTSVDLDMVV